MSVTTLLIGSSNVSRFYSDLDPKWREDMKFVKCTKIEVLRAILDDTKFERIIISVVENFLAEAVENLLIKEKEEVEKAIDVTMKDYLDAVVVAADKWPNTKFALVEPMRRPALPWYETKLEDIITFHNRCILKMKRPNIDRINGLLHSSQHFDSFGVHLVPASGIAFIEMIIANADDLFEVMDTDVVEIEYEEMKEVEDEGKKIEERKEKPREKEDVIKLNVTGLPERTSKLEEQMKAVQDGIAARTSSDNLVFARMREELDYRSNCKREDRILIIGLTSDEARPTAQADLKAWLTKLVGEVLDKITKGSAAGVAFVNPMRGGGGGILPICEVRLKSRELALQIRKDFAAMRKNGGEGLGKLFVANSVTLATRVRLDIMKAIAKKCENKAEQMFVRGFSSRPVLQVRQRDGSRPPLTLTFADAVGRFGKKLKDAELAGAYRRAGRAFAGELEQNFVVLFDPVAIKMGRGEGGSEGRPAFLSAPNKRPLAPNRGNTDKKRINLKKKAL